MDIKSLVANVDRFREIEAPMEEVEEIFRVLLSERLHLDSDFEMRRLVNYRHYKVYEVYDIPAAGCDVCKLWLLCQDGEPIALYGLHGYDEDADGVITVIDGNWIAETVHEMFMKHARNQADALRTQILKEEVDPSTPLSTLGGRNYITFLNDTVFGVRNAAGSDFSRLLGAEYKAYVRTNSGLEPVLELQTLKVVESGVVVKTQAGEVEVPRQRLLFQIGESLKDLDSALELMTAEGGWRWDSKKSNIPSGYLVAFVREPFQWNYQQLVLEFETDALIQAFIAKYPADVLRTEMFSGGKVQKGIGIYFGNE